MPLPEGKSPPPRVRIGLALLVLLGLSAFAAWKVPIPARVPTVAWNSSWVFRAEAFVGSFVGAYVVLAIVLTTIRTGQPPRKLSFGMISYEEAEVEKAADALNEGRVALQAVQEEVDGLRERLTRTASSVRAAHENVLALAVDNPRVAAISERAQQEIEGLTREEEAVKMGQSEFDRAMSKLEQTLSELDQMLERPKRIRHAR